jgi:hypothetical protein
MSLTIGGWPANNEKILTSVLKKAVISLRTFGERCSLDQKNYHPLTVHDNKAKSLNLHGVMARYLPS